jgi:hypothetical protein
MQIHHSQHHNQASFVFSAGADTGGVLVSAIVRDWMLVLRCVFFVVAEPVEKG